VSSLDQLTERLRTLAGEISAEQDPERAAELVAEASKLAAEAGEEAERAVRDASASPDAAAAPPAPDTGA
jgi:hypothetical protein